MTGYFFDPVVWNSASSQIVSVQVVKRRRGEREKMEDVLKKSAADEEARKDEKPHPTEGADAVRYACEVYGLGTLDAGEVKELESYDDRNFVLPSTTFTYQGSTSTTTSRTIFKIHNGVESDNPALISAHNAVLEHLLSSGVAVPEPLKIKDGSAVIGWISLPRIRAPSETRKHAVRLFGWIEGVVVGQTASEKDELWRDIGKFVGRMDKKLLEIPEVPSALRGRVHMWDLKNVPALSGFKDYIDDKARQELQQRVIDAFVDRVQPKIPHLRSAVIQNDANEMNILIDEQRTKVAAIIDFGDCLETCLVFEIAICLAYMMLAKTDPVHAASHIYAGYVEELPLTQDEEDILHLLIMARLVQSVTMSAFSSSKDPTNDYLKITATTGWTLLADLDRMGQQEFMLRLKNPK